ncbi:hypothetical protein F4810DRAFT_673458, partial [Camillea tinctor]
MRRWCLSLSLTTTVSPSHSQETLATSDNLCQPRRTHVPSPIWQSELEASKVCAAAGRENAGDSLVLSASASFESCSRAPLPLPTCARIVWLV